MRRALALSAFTLLAACSHEAMRAPELPKVEQYTTTPVVQTAGADVPGGQAQVFTANADIPAQWWTLFHSPALDRLVREALGASPTIASAAARLRQAEEDLGARRDATDLPKVDAKLTADRLDIPAGALGGPAIPISSPFNLYFATVNVSYTLDLFGSTRNELASLAAAADYQRYELEAARLMLAGNVVTTAIREASLRAQVADTEAMIALESQQLAITEQMEGAGGASHADVLNRRSELAKSRASLPDLQKALQQAHHRLAVYTGRPPSAPDLPEFSLAELQLPSELPLTLPSELARQRPDIRASEALLEQASAKVGVATANLYPQITLSAQGGSLAGKVGDLFTSGNGFYFLSAGLTQPIFHGGELQAKRRSAVAAYDQAAAAYRDAVLKGLQDVADALRALQSDAEKLKERADVTAHARESEKIASARYGAGGVSRSALLDAQRKLRSTHLDETQAVADRYADSAALLQALGGGWWKDEPGAAGGPKSP